MALVLESWSPQHDAVNQTAPPDHRVRVITVASRSPTCPCAAAKVDLCPFAVMAFTDEHMTCQYRSIVQHGESSTALCASPERSLYAPLARDPTPSSADAELAGTAQR
jgi:hypothetical protein